MTERGEGQHQTTKHGPISPLSARPHSCTKTRQTLVLKNIYYKIGEAAQPFKVDDAWLLKSSQYKNMIKVGLSSLVPPYGGGESKNIDKHELEIIKENQFLPSSWCFAGINDPPDTPARFSSRLSPLCPHHEADSTALILGLLKRFWYYFLQLLLVDLCENNQEKHVTAW